MYKLCLLFLLATPSTTALPAAAPPQATQTGDAANIRHVLDVQSQAWNRGDIPAFMQAYWQSDSLTFIGKAGPAYGYQPTLDRYKKSYPDKATMGFLTYSNLQLKRLSDSYYFIIGNWHLKRDMGDIGGTFTLLMRKIDGQWKIVVDHTS